MLKAEIQIGLVKKTDLQMKKHYTQFTKEEQKYLDDFRKSINFRRMQISRHLIEKKAVTYNRKDIEETLASDSSKVIEYNVVYGETRTDRRILVRGTKEINTNKGKCNLCVVYSLVYNRVITVYYNDARKDTHKNLNMSRYTEHLKVVKEKR